MNTDIRVEKITLKIGATRVDVSLEELRALQKMLNDFFGQPYITSGWIWTQPTRITESPDGLTKTVSSVYPGNTLTFGSDIIENEIK